jgi:hypothetical protein
VRTLTPLGGQAGSTTAAVQVGLQLSPSKRETIVVLFALQADGSWLADDTYCNSDPANRLSAPAPTRCA